MTTKENINRIKSNPKIRLFLVLLFLSAFYWFFTSLSEKYSYRILYNINYTSIPENLFFQKTPPDLIPIQIEATGFEIIKQQIFPNSVSFDMSLFKPLGNYKYYFEPNKQKFSSQSKTDNTTLKQFLTDSIIVYLGRFKTKKIPIISKVQLAFKPSFKLRNELQILPDSLLVKGPEQFVDSLNSIQTAVVVVNDIEQDLHLEVDLILPKSSVNRTYFSTSKVQLKANVAKFTEGTMVLPIIFPKLPDGKKIELFPKNVKITYEVAFDQYQKINQDSFKVRCTSPNDSIESKTLDLELIKKPHFVTNYSLHPKEVTYLIQETKK